MSPEPEAVPLHAERADKDVADAYNRKEFARRLAYAVAHRPDREPFIIGLGGTWGEGKSTVLAYMAEELEDRFGDVSIVQFNPWMYPSEAELLRALRTSILEGLGRAHPPDEAKLKAVLGDLATYSGQALKLVGDLTGQGLASRGGEALSAAGGALKGQPTDDTALKKKVEQLLRESGAHCVILIDDLDRLTHGEIRQVFRLIKAIFDLPALTYVLAYDPEIVAAALANHYGTFAPDAGHRYLEKIVQLPLQLPRPDEVDVLAELEKGFTTVLENQGITLNDLDAERLRYLMDVVLAPRVRTPREVKRLTNAVAFALPILRGETNPVDIIYVESLRLLFPEEFKLVRDNSEWFTEESQVLRRQLSSHMAALMGQPEPAPDLPMKFRERFGELDDLPKNLLSAMFPEFSAWQHVFAGVPTAEHFSVSKAQYFRRYFQYAIPSDDTPDHLVQKFVTSLQTVPATADAVLDEQVGRRSFNAFLRKASQRVKDAPTEVKRAFVLNIACRMDDLAQVVHKGPFHPFNIARGEIQNVISMLPVEGREVALIDVLNVVSRSDVLYELDSLISLVKRNLTHYSALDDTLGGTVNVERAES